ncbi:MAG: glycosyltransferase family 2 protein [Butyrivibrio sp.]|nr:glycosyltransferase family 2 protein [Butyrivibrio sp.]
MTDERRDRSVSVVLPTYRPGPEVLTLIEMLERQSVQPEKIVIVNTEASFWEQLTRMDSDGILGRYDNLTLRHVTKRDFDHGGTRNLGVSLTDTEYFLMITQDAMPRDVRVIACLLQALSGDPQAVAAYARQYPRSDCGLEERYLRKFNYPGEARRKTKDDLPELGIKTYFCSNVCAMYRRSVFDALGGFPEPSIFNEDMVYAGRAVQQGYAVWYVPEAGVIHSHNYTFRQQFTRNFDLGVSQTDHPEIFTGISSESEGRKMLRETLQHFLHIGKGLLIPHFLAMCGARFIGYRLGRGYRHLPRGVIRICTMNREYWNKRW